jgi:uncharacterized protein (TIGR02271 family)
LTDASLNDNQRIITAFFDDRGAAESAMNKLISLGVRAEGMRLVEGRQDGEREGDQPDRQGGSFWEALKDMFMPDEDRHAYAEGLEQGGYLLSVAADQDNYEQVIDVLDDEGTVDMDEREASWRSEGWSGYDQSASAASPRDAAWSTSSSIHDRSAAADMTNENEVIPVAEERLRVGKRDVSHGRVRVRSYVVEEPVSESVNLREENVNVQRRPVDRPLTGNERIFEDRTIEVEERGEEAVVAKEARVTEEVVVTKDVNERTEDVSDKVRHTEVEVEDGRQLDQPPERRQARR